MLEKFLQTVSRYQEPLTEGQISQVRDHCQELLKQQVDFDSKIPSGYFPGTSLLWWVMRVCPAMDPIYSQLEAKIESGTMNCDLSNADSYGRDLLFLALTLGTEEIEEPSFLKTTEPDFSSVTHRLRFLKRIGITLDNINLGKVECLVPNTSFAYNGWSSLSVAIRHISQGYNGSWELLRDLGVTANHLVSLLRHNDLGHADPFLIAMLDAKNNNQAGLKTLEPLGLTTEQLNFSSCTHLSSCRDWNMIDLALQAASLNRLSGIEYLSKLGVSALQYDSNSYGWIYEHRMHHLTYVMQGIFRRHVAAMDFLTDISPDYSTVDCQTNLTADNDPIWQAFYHALNGNNQGLDFIRKHKLRVTNWNTAPTNGAHREMTCLWMVFFAMSTGVLSPFRYFLEVEPSEESLNYLASARGNPTVTYSRYGMLRPDLEPMTMEMKPATESVSIFSLLITTVENIIRNQGLISSLEFSEQFSVVKFFFSLPLAHFLSDDEISFLEQKVNQKQLLSLQLLGNAMNCDLPNQVGYKELSNQTQVMLLIKFLHALQARSDESFVTTFTTVRKQINKLINRIIKRPSLTEIDCYILYELSELLNEFNQHESENSCLIQIPSHSQYYRSANLKLASYYASNCKSAQDVNFIPALKHAIEANADSLRCTLVLMYCGLDRVGLQPNLYTRYPNLKYLPKCDMSVHDYLKFMNRALKTESSTPITDLLSEFGFYRETQADKQAPNDEQDHQPEFPDGPEFF